MTSIDLNGAAARLYEREIRHYLQARPRSAALAAQAREHFLYGVPMHWMADWPMPHPLFIASAQGVTVNDVDGHGYTDFCLGDTGAMFGHAPEAVAGAIAEQARRGLTMMLPTPDAVPVGAELARRFGLRYWQVTATATDANRAVLRWARAVTGRKVILVFHGCYHGTVDDTMVRLSGDRTVPRAGLLGQAYDLGEYSRVIEFNDTAALERALEDREVAAVLAEPAMTNCGMVLPQPGYHAELRQLTRRYGTPLIIDETHTISTGPGGFTRAAGLEPDFLVLGKPIAGGLPCAVYGCTPEMADRMQAARISVPHGHSGIGTTLSANALALHAMRANLESVMTEQAYRHMIPLAEHLAGELRAVFAVAGVPWSVTQLGARCEFQFCRALPRNGSEAEAAMNPTLESAIHMYLLNRGVIITPFHNMMLVAPDTRPADVERLVTALRDCIHELRTP
ncbi:MAG: Glutamate-1-semialdehyde 2,1-aminomutase [Gammaproteobacteria bacterium]|nr:Glutamate-1-semialdehyde 2,1-aminomutase [Gammaproteobacteria bacterium]